jgi:heme/copper-type cytochrome/quinol oxidase subunit 3
MTEIQDSNAIDQLIHRRSTVKAIGMTMLFITGIVIFNLAFDIVKLLTENPLSLPQEEIRQEFDSMLRNATMMTVAMFLVALLYATCGMGLMKFKQWSLLLFHALSLVLVVVFVGLLIVIYIQGRPSLFQTRGANDQLEIFGMLMRSQTGILLMFVLWIIVRVNILLFRKEYRREFK